MKLYLIYISYLLCICVLYMCMLFVCLCMFVSLCVSVNVHRWQNGCHLVFWDKMSHRTSKWSVQEYWLISKLQKMPVFTHTSTNIIDIHEDFLLHFYLFSHVLHPDCTFHSFLSFQSLLPQSTLLSQIHSSFFFLRKEQVSLNYQKMWHIKG